MHYTSNYNPNWLALIGTHDTELVPIGKLPGATEEDFDSPVTWWRRDSAVTQRIWLDWPGLPADHISQDCPLTQSPPSAAYMRWWIRSALVKVMACHLFGAKPLPEPMLTYCQLDP